MSALDRFYFKRMPARRLAGVRVYVGLYAAVYLLVRLPHLLGFAAYDAAFFAPVGVASLLDVPLPPLLYQGLVALTVALSWAFLFGVAHRWLAPVFAASLLFVLTYTNSFGKILHTDNMLVLHVAILALASSADSLSLDARRSAPSSPHWRYGWPVQLLCAVTAAVYLLAGIAKLRHSGLAFFDGENLRNYIAFDNVRKAELGSVSSPIGPALLAYTGVFALLAWVSLALELGAPLALFHRPLGRAWAVAVMAFHLGVLALMAIAFAYPLSGAAFAAFFDLERMPLPRLGRGSAPRSPELPVHEADRASESEAHEA